MRKLLSEKMLQLKMCKNEEKSEKKEKKERKKKEGVRLTLLTLKVTSLLLINFC